MKPDEVLALVRKGFAVATPGQVAIATRCAGVTAVGPWVPRWALDAQELHDELALLFPPERRTHPRP